jgi:hypothetical protein
MTDTYNINQAMDQAVAEVHRKIATNKMFRSGDESPESEDFTNGDPETIFSIASLYAQYVDDDFNNASDAILDKLSEIFPEYA